MTDDFDDESELPQPRRLRIIPLTMTMLALMLVIQINEIYNDSLRLRAVYGVHEAQAADEKIEGDKQKAQDSQATTTKDNPAAAGNDATSDKTASDKPADASAKTPNEEVKSADTKPAEGKDAKAGDDKAAKPPEEPKTFGTGKSTVKEIEALKAKQDVPRFSQNEIDLLENLSKRREELDTRERDLDVKAKVLEATEKRINDKLAEMKTLDAQLSKVVAQYNEKQSAQIDSLVKIYSNMKPVDAAGIFNQLDMPILLEVVSKMSERKVSPVLAAMDPKKAKDVTEELAAMRKKQAVPAAATAK